MTGKWKRIEFREMKIAAFMLFLTITCLNGCLQNERKVTTQELLQAQTRDYPGFTAEQVLEGSEKIFKLADKGDFTFKRDSSVLQAKRSLGSLVFSSTWESWKIEAKEEHGSTLVNVSVEFEREGTKKYPQDFGAYHLFYSRLDYQLGVVDEWITCGQYKEQTKAEPTWGNEGYLCFHADDAAPQAP